MAPCEPFRPIGCTYRPIGPSGPWGHRASVLTTQGHLITLDGNFPSKVFGCTYRPIGPSAQKPPRTLCVNQQMLQSASSNASIAPPGKL